MYLQIRFCLARVLTSTTLDIAYVIKLEKSSLDIQVFFSKMSSAMSHHSHEIYLKNAGECCLQPPMPLPPQEGFPFEMKGYKDVNEPK